MSRSASISAAESSWAFGGAITATGAAADDLDFFAGGDAVNDVGETTSSVSGGHS